MPPFVVRWRKAFRGFALIALGGKRNSVFDRPGESRRGMSELMRSVCGVVTPYERLAVRGPPRILLLIRDS